MTALLLAIAAAITATAVLIARRRTRRPARVGRHTGGYVLAEIAKAAERGDLMTASQRFRIDLADRCAAPWKALENRRAA